MKAMIYNKLVEIGMFVGTYQHVGTMNDCALAALACYLVG